MKNAFIIQEFRKSSIDLFTKLILSGILLLITNQVLLQAQTVPDIDGNVYNTVTIGTQVWMAENLKTTKYNDNTDISLVVQNSAWEQLTTSAYCWYDDDATTYKADNGALYNWYAVSATTNGGKNICPAGWHVPTDGEFSILVTYLGGQGVAGGKLKESGTTHWLTPNTGATNERGFTALPSGYRDYNGTFHNFGLACYWWSSTEYSTTNPWYHMIAYDNGGLGWNNEYSKNAGFSVRCLRDLLTDMANPATSVIEIYPNPVSGILTIEYNNDNYKKIKIINSQGLLLTKATVISQRQQLDFSKYAPGLYILEFIKASGEVTRVKVVNR